MFVKMHATNESICLPMFLKKTKQKTASPFLLFQVKNNILKDTFKKNTNYRIKSVFIFEIFLTYI
jgi:hypothetical protein